MCRACCCWCGSGGSVRKRGTMRQGQGQPGGSRGSAQPSKLRAADDVSGRSGSQRRRQCRWGISISLKSPASSTRAQGPELTHSCILRPRLQCNLAAAAAAASPFNQSDVVHVALCGNPAWKSAGRPSIKATPWHLPQSTQHSQHHMHPADSLGLSQESHRPCHKRTTTQCGRR